MSATIQIIKTYGAGPAGTEANDTEFGLKAVDDHATAPADAPVVIPDITTVYSFESWMRFKCTVAPSNECTNFKIWGSGAAVGTGLVLTVNSTAIDTYATPIDEVSAQGTRVNFASHGVGAKINVAGTLVDIDDETDFSVFQLEVGATAVPGDITPQDVNFSYDES